MTSQWGCFQNRVARRNFWLDLFLCRHEMMPVLAHSLGVTCSARASLWLQELPGQASGGGACADWTAGGPLGLGGLWGTGPPGGDSRLCPGRAARRPLPSRHAAAGGGLPGALPNALSVLRLFKGSIDAYKFFFSASDWLKRVSVHHCLSITCIAG